MSTEIIERVLEHVDLEGRDAGYLGFLHPSVHWQDFAAELSAMRDETEFLRAKNAALDARVAELEEIARAIRLAGVTFSGDGLDIYSEDLEELATAIRLAADQEHT